jgi:uncharacterized caspase-like protein
MLTSHTHRFSPLCSRLGRAVRIVARAVATLLAALLPAALPELVHAEEHPTAALVIGNGAYTDVNSLRNAVNDARQICKELHSLLSFPASCQYDVPTRAAMQAHISDFIDSLPEDAVRIIYYAGHGLQIGGENYLIPTSLQLTPGEVSSVPEQAVSLSFLMRQLSRKQAYLTIIILDACRNNPLSTQEHPAAAAGLAEIRDIPDSTELLYATASNGVAIDDQGDNGTLTKNLLAHLHDAGTVDDIFKSVSLGVQSDTVGLTRIQKPELRSNFTGQHCLVRCTDAEILQERIADLAAQVQAGNENALGLLAEARAAQQKLHAAASNATKDEKWRKAAKHLPSF